MKKVKHLVSVLLGLSLLMTVICMYFTFSLTVLLLLPSLLILIVVAIPILISKDVDLFSPLPYLFYFLFLHVFLRTLYIINDVPDEETINDIFLLGKTKESLLFPLIIFLIGFVSMSIGYMNKPISFWKSNTILDVNNWNNTRFNIVISVAIVISVCALYKFVTISIDSIFLLAVENASSYRGLSDDLADYNSNGYLRFLIQFSDIVFYLTFVKHILSKKKSKFNVLILCVSFLVSVSFYFFVQSRASMMLLFINPIVLRYYLVKKGVNALRVTVIAVICLSFFGFVTSLRVGSGYSQDKLDILYPVHALEPLIVNNGGIDVSKTGHIINYIDKNNDLRFGNTFSWIFIAWIPRGFWPEKPVNLDTEVGMKIYGATTYGSGAVPPGLFVELYWNFWFIGIIIGSWVAGLVLKTVHNYFITKNRGVNDTVTYVLCFMPIGLGLFGSSINSVIAGLVFSIIPLKIAFLFITQKNK
ncbi:MAG: O-antigen polymerase [Bacteroidota bacterium]